MKALRLAALVLLAGAAAYPQTQDLGLGTFSNTEGAIRMVIDASLVDQKMDSPYVMFMAYMGAAQQNRRIDVTRDTVVMTYNGQEYKMPSVQELRKNYNGQKTDIGLYARLGKESVILSEARFYEFAAGGDFFPVLGMGPSIPRDMATLSGNIGFRTKLYFKNPGFKKGDTLTIKVWDKNNPALEGEVAVILR